MVMVVAIYYEYTWYIVNRIFLSYLIVDPKLIDPKLCKFEHNFYANYQPNLC